MKGPIRFLITILLVVSLGLGTALPAAIPAFADDTTLKSPTANYNNNNSVGNPQNAYASNNSYAVFDSLADEVEYANFNFPSIPEGSTINGIEVSVEANGNNRSLNISLSWNGSTDFTSPKTIGNFQVSDTIQTVGANNDAWGRTWSVSDFTNANFRVRVKSNQSQTVNLDHLQVRVTYTPPTLPTVTGAETSEDGSIITITFSKAMADPSGKYEQFTYQIGSGDPQSFSAATLGVDTSTIDLTVDGDAIQYGDTVAVSYTAGDVAAADSTLLASFTGQAVTNNVPDLSGFEVAGPTEDIEAGEAFDLEITDAADVDGDPLNGNIAVTVTSDLDGEVYNNTVTFDTGEAMLEDIVLTTAGDHTLTVAVTGVTGTETVDVTVIPAAFDAGQSTVEVNSNTVAAGGTVAVTVTPKDEFDNLLGTGETVVVLLDDDDTDISVTDEGDGTYTASVLMTDISADNVISATVNGAAITQTQTITVTAGEADSMSISDQPVETVAGQIIGPVTVFVENEFGIGVAGVSVTVAEFGDYNFDTGTLTQTTDASGIATFDNMVINTAGEGYKLVFSSTGLDDATSDSFNVIPAAAAGIEISVDDDEITAGETATFSAISVDEYGNEVADVTAETEFEIDEEAGGSWDETDPNVYTSEFAGEWTVTATYGSFTDTLTLTVTAGDADSMSISNQPGETVAGQIIGPVTVFVENEFGIGVAGVSVTVAEFGDYNFDTGTLTQTTDASGIATFDNLVINTAGEGYKLVFSSAGLDDATSNAFEVIPAGAAGIEISTGSSTIVTGQTAAFTAISVDEYGNEIGDVTANTEFEIDEEAGGSWDDNVYTSGNEGEWEVTGTYGEFTDTFTLTVTLVLVDYLEVVEEPSDAAAGAVIRPAIEVKAFDESDDPVPGARITVSLKENGDAVLSGTLTQTADENGIATFDDLSVDAVGEDYVLVFASGEADVESASFDIFEATVFIGNTPYSSIQQAIDYAVEGDVITLTGENYEEDLEIDKSLTLAGAGCFNHQSTVGFQRRMDRPFQCL